MNKFLLYKNVRLYGELFEKGEVVEYDKLLDPSIALLLKGHEGEYRKLSLVQKVYVYDNKEEKESNEPVKSSEGGNSNKGGNKVVKSKKK